MSRTLLQSLKALVISSGTTARPTPSSPPQRRGKSDRPLKPSPKVRKVHTATGLRVPDCKGPHDITFPKFVEDLRSLNPDCKHLTQGQAEEALDAAIKGVLSPKDGRKARKKGGGRTSGDDTALFEMERVKKELAEFWARENHVGRAGGELPVQLSVAPKRRRRRRSSDRVEAVI